MACHGLLLRAYNVIGNYRTILTKRPTLLSIQQTNIKQKHEAVDKLNELNIPDKPKKPLTPFFKFLQEMRPSVTANHPDWKVTDVTKKCAEDWKSINAEKKLQYEEAFQRELAEYNKKILAYSTHLSPEHKEAIKDAAKEKRDDKKKRALRKELKEAGKPKRPAGAYMHFIKKQCQTRNLKFSEIAQLKTEWNQLSETEKSTYKALNQEDKVRYEKEMKSWERKMIEEGKEHLIRKRKSEKTPLHEILKAGGSADAMKTAKLREVKKSDPQ